jgi:hypothetical protein
MIRRRILKGDGNGIKSTTRVRNGNTAGTRGVIIPVWTTHRGLGWRGSKSHICDDRFWDK